MITVRECVLKSYFDKHLFGFGIYCILKRSKRSRTFHFKFFQEDFHENQVVD